MSTIELARGTRLHQEAVAEHASASEQSQHNESRLNEVRDRMATITERRVSGKASDQEAAEYAALQGDAALLQKMLTAAKQAESVAAEKMHAAFHYYTDALVAHNRELAKAKFQALKEQCQQIEAMFVKALGEVGRAGRAIGISTLGQCYQKSDTLHRALDLNMTPD